VPRQNRVTPFGEIIATPERGTFMGNRGLLHDAEGRIWRAWQLQRWLACVTEFRGRRRAVMTPGSYTELFFLDEATALAAGHRPCAECRHDRFLAYSLAWGRAHPGDSTGRRPGAEEIDRHLYAERVNPDRSKRTFTAALDGLPDRVFVTVEEPGGRAYLVWRDRLLPWSPGGYGRPLPRKPGVTAAVLTPPSSHGRGRPERKMHY
jgi:hypothetical protein